MRDPEEQAKIQVGDVVAVLEHQWAPKLYPHAISTRPYSEGWVVTGEAPLDGKHDPRRPSDHDCFTLEKLPERDEGWQPNQMTFVVRQNLRLLKKGSGTFTRGVDLPFNEGQRRVMRFEEFRKKVAQAIIDRGTHEGWRNPATWYVHLQLANCQEFINQILPGLWRKDGTVNYSKLAKVWTRLKARKLVEPIEDWMRASPIEVPEEFAKWKLPELEALRVDWIEIAADFKRSPAKT